MPIISDTGQTNIGHQELGMSFLARGGRANGMSGSEAGGSNKESCDKSEIPDKKVTFKIVAKQLDIIDQYNKKELNTPPASLLII